MRDEPQRRELPREHIELLDRIEESCASDPDPIRASGFGGGSARWRAEREPLLDGVAGSGSLLDVGCANGYLLQCLVEWGRERGIELTPHGVDRSERLIERARSRLPGFAANLHVGDARTWVPPVRYDYVYSLCDCVPEDYLTELVEHLLHRAVRPGGRLIMGAYGSRSRDLRPFDIERFLRSKGYEVLGSSTGGEPPIAMFVWLDRTARSS